MDALQRITLIFERFPGIGPRQAQRFVHFLLRSSPALRQELAESIIRIGKAVHECVECHRFFEGTASVCVRCNDTSRDRSLLMIVATDSDADAIERSGTFKGTYFILGGLMQLGTDRKIALRETACVTLIKKRATENLVEIIIALPANTEGDVTTARIKEIIEPLGTAKITVLGRGLSTGSELEYADPDTIRNALTNRK
ncbi:MAG: toprim domain-containing protein [Patescibacteria group bacterium]